MIALNMPIPPQAVMRKWSDGETTLLRRHYSNLGATETAKQLGTKTPLQVREKANKLHLCLTKEMAHKLVHSQARKYMTSNNPMKRPEVRAKVRAWQTEHPEVQRHIQECLFEGHQRLEKANPSKLEFRLRNYLDILGIQYEASYLIKPKFIVDAKIGMTIIQADGDYWHGHPRFVPLTERQIAQRRRDAAQDAYLRKSGYTIIRIWESDMTLEHLRSVLDLNS